MDSEVLSATFQVWADNDRRVQSLGIEELAGLSKNLATLGRIGLQALDYAESGKPAPKEWVSEQKRVLDQMEKPTAEVKLAAARTVRQLLGSL